MSHETIYQSLYVQARGGLKRELTALPAHRPVDAQAAAHAPGERRGRIPDMVMISERPPEVEDRAVPGHWEGDLIMGSTASNSAVGTLVERTTGFVMLLHLPDGHGALAVQEAMVAKMADPARAAAPVADLGPGHARWPTTSRSPRPPAWTSTSATPTHPGSAARNENTNGLLRQYLPKGTDLSFYGPGMLDNIAAELNARPRKRHGLRHPRRNPRRDY